jgi:hypothetical protein
MTGSSLAPFIIPIVAMICLAALLIAVYYADSHPEWKSARQEPGHRVVGEARPPEAGPPEVASRAGRDALTGEPPPVPARRNLTGTGSRPDQVSPA